MLCPICKQEARKSSKNRNGSQRYYCPACQKYFTDEQTRPTDRRCVEKEKMIFALRMLLEGNSIRSVERLLGIHRDTIINAMIAAGIACRQFVDARHVGLTVGDLQADEHWGFVFCKERTRIHEELPDHMGDVWCFTAIASESKLLVTWHIGKRTGEDAAIFADRLSRAINGRFQLTTDAWPGYNFAIANVLGNRVDWGVVRKVFGLGVDWDAPAHRRYSPGIVKEVVKTVKIGAPDEDRVSTSYVERANKTFRMGMRRLTRLTDGHSKKLENHEAAVALFIAYYNYCRVHSTVKMTPANAAGLTSETWSLERLLAEANRVAG